MNRSDLGSSEGNVNGGVADQRSPYLTLTNLMARNPELAARFAHFYRKLKQMSARQRRWLLRKAAVTMTGAALLLALSGPPAYALTINVAAGEVVVADDGVCSLREAIDNANNTATGQTHTDCAAGNPAGADTIVLPNNATFNVPNYVDYYYGYTGLPPVTSQVTIEGNGSTITRAGNKEFRLLAVVNSGDLTLNDATVSNGYEPYYYGGAILVYNATLTLNDSTLSGNTAENGGAIGATYYSDVTINNSSLSGNSAYYGGAVYVNYGSLTVENSTLTGNTAESGSGGAIHQWGNLDLDGALIDSLIIRNSDLSGNKATFDGGALSVISSKLTVENTVVSNNTAELSYGGAGYITDSEIVLTDSEFNGNTAYAGGGLTILGSSLTLSGSMVTGNSATGSNTGGIGLYDTIASIVDSQISENVTAANGGGVYLLESQVTLLDSTLANNEADSGNGGGIYISAAAYNGNPDPGTTLPDEVTLRRVTLTNNSAANGGGLATASSGELLVDNSALSANSAAAQGGAVYAGGADSDIVIEASTISGNTASSNGGGIAAVNGRIEVTTSTVAQNESSSDGGGLFATGANTVVNIFRSLFTSNSASNGGGVGTGSTGEVAVTNSTLHGNDAKRGGGIHALNEVVVTNSTVSGNSADSGGGLNNGATGSTQLVRSLFAGNTAPTGREARNQGGTVTTNDFNVFGFSGNGGLAGLTAGANDVVPATGLATILASALADNGGPTQTLALPEDSPAIDLAPSGDCAAAPTNNVDQRGAQRNQDGDGQQSSAECDSGAFEVGELIGNRAFVPITVAP